MSAFTKWLVEKGYTSSEDADTIISELSGPEADYLYEEFINEGGSDE